jgi:Flp pilus assembly protein TadG
VINFTARASGWTTTDATVTTAEANPLGTGATYTGTPQLQNAARVSAITVRVGDFATPGSKGNSANNPKPVDGAYSATITVTLTPSS